MPSSFKSLNLFGSGPHRFALGKRGQLVVSDFALGGSGAGSTPQGLIELDVVVTGRLVASSESALWTLRDAVAAQLTDPLQTGTLIDLHGRTFTGMSFITFEQTGPTDRNRQFSLPYRAVFRAF
ncbi:MAG: hypothetical protein PSX37_00880 [bacterium]|nr:hypothetical protein [bacterium]